MRQWICLLLGALATAACSTDGSGQSAADDSVSQLTRRLAASARALASSSGAERAQLLTKAVDVARARAEAMRRLIEDDPARLLELAIDDKARAALPPEVRAHLERRVETRGELFVTAIHSHDPAHAPELRHELRSALGHHRLRFVDAPRAELQTDDALLVSGVALADELVVDRATKLPSSARASTGLTKTGAQNVLVILVNFEDAPDNMPYSAAQLDALLFGNVSDFYRENTLGQTHVVGKTVGPYTLPYKSSECFGDYLAFYNSADKAIAAAKADGVDTSGYQSFFLVFPRLPCFWAGRGTIGGAPARSWINGAVKLRTLAHELGHNFGMHHSHSLVCDDGTLGGTCGSDNYGNIADIMGGAQSGHFNAFQKQRMGWLDAPGFGAITTVTTTGDYSITNYEKQDVQPKALRLLKSVNLTTARKTYYYIEQRQPIGFDAQLGSGATEGVLVTIATEGEGNSSHLLDLTPETPTMADAALPLGKTFLDKQAGVAITLLSARPDGVEVHVEVGAKCERRAAEVTLDPPTASGQAGGQQTFTATVTNRDSWACAGASFALSSAASIGLSAALGRSSVDLDPGASATVALTVTSSADAASGSVSLTATHAADASLSATTSASYEITTAPCLHRAPTVSLAPSSASGAPGETRQYTVTVRNEDSAHCAASTFAQSASTSGGWTHALGASSKLLAPGESAQTTLSVTAPSDAQAGSFHVGLTITHGADSALLSTAAASYVVTKPACTRAAPEVAVAPSPGAVAPGSDVRFTVTLTDRDSAPCSDSVVALSAIVPAGWSASHAASVALAPGRSAQTTLTITSPPDAVDGPHSVSVQAHANGQSSSASAVYTVSRPQCTPAAPSVSLTPIDGTQARAGSALRYAVVVVNRDSAPCGPVTFTLSPTPPAGFRASALAALPLLAGASGATELTVTAPYGAQQGARVVTVRAVHGADASLVGQAEGPFVVAGGLQVVLAPVRREVEPGERTTLGLRVSRDGLPVDWALAHVRLQPPGGAAIERDVAVRAGVAQVDYLASRRQALGGYAVSVSVSDHGEHASAADSFIVAKAASHELGPDRQVAANDSRGGQVSGGCGVAGRAPDAGRRGALSLSMLLLLLLLFVRRRRRR